MAFKNKHYHRIRLLNYFLKNNLQNLEQKNLNQLLQDKYFYSILPLIAWLRENHKECSSLQSFIKLAYKDCLRYN